MGGEMSAAQPWNSTTVKELFEVRYGKANPGRSGDVPVIGSSGIYAWTDVALVHEPTIVVGRKGSAGQVWYIEKPCFPSDTTFYLMRRAEVDVDPEFAAYALRAQGVGASDDVIPSLQRHELENCEIPFPDPIEQRSIARILRNIETATKVEAAICDKLAALKSATMAKLFREGLRGEPLKQTEVGEIPESWEVKPVSAVSDAVSGGTPSKQRTDWWSGSIPWASPKDMKKLRLRDTEDHISPEAAEAGSRIVPPKTVFIVVRGMVLAKDVPVAITEVPMAFNQDMKALLPSERINPDFLLYALCARKSALIQEIGTSAHGTRRMSGSSVHGLLIPVPKDSEEQRDIAETLHMLDRREEISKERVRCLQALFSSTLHALMTGAVRVKDLDLAEVSHA